MTEEEAGAPIPFDWARKVVTAAIAAVLIAGVCLLAWHHSQPPQRCAPGMVPLGARCCGEGQQLQDERCRGKPSACAAGMTITEGGCVPDGRIVPIAGGRLELGPVDWEAQQRVKPYTALVGAFAIDSHEVTEGDWAACVARGTCPPRPETGEPGRAVAGVTATEAETYCRFRGGTLPTRDQWAFASLGPRGHRYPWGVTGAVCRRAAFGLAQGAQGPELSGSHPDGVSPEGVHDLAGNVAEWTAPVEGRSSVRGGSWQDSSAASLRGWSFVRLDAEQRSPAVGFRCVYPASSAQAATPRQPASAAPLGTAPLSP